MISAMLALAMLNVRFALVSDPHVTRGTNEDQPLYRGRFERTIESVNSHGVDAVLMAGDLTQGGKADEFADYRELAGKFKAPVYAVPGNHDVGGKVLPNEKGVTAARVTNFEKIIGPTFWSQTIKGVRVLGIDSPVLGSGLPVENDQWTFLDKELDKPHEEPTLVLTHYPPFLDKVDEPGGTYWNIEPAPRARLLALLHKGGVAAVLSGHLHRPIEHTIDGILFSTTPPVSFGLPRGKQAQGWTLVTITGSAVKTEFVPVDDK